MTGFCINQKLYGGVIPTVFMALWKKRKKMKRDVCSLLSFQYTKIALVTVILAFQTVFSWEKILSVHG